MEKLPRPYQQFREDHPEVFRAYETLGEVIAQRAPFEPKVRELMKLGMAAAMGLEGAVHSHTHRALKVGATPSEVEHTLMMGVTTLGFPRMMAAITWAKAAIEASAGTEG